MDSRVAMLESGRAGPRIFERVPHHEFQTCIDGCCTYLYIMLGYMYGVLCNLTVSTLFCISPLLLPKAVHVQIPAWFRSRGILTSAKQIANPFSMAAFSHLQLPLDFVGAVMFLIGFRVSFLFAHVHNRAPTWKYQAVICMQLRHTFPRASELAGISGERCRAWRARAQGRAAVFSCR